MGVVTNLFKFYFFLFVILSHTSLLTCRYKELKISNDQLDYRKINSKLQDQCHKVKFLLCFDENIDTGLNILSVRVYCDASLAFGWFLSHAYEYSLDDLPIDIGFLIAERAPFLSGRDSPCLVINFQQYLKFLVTIC